MIINSAKYVRNPDNGENEGVVVVTDSKTIQAPMILESQTYQAVLEWVAEGNTITPADEP